jgi:DNA-binding NarL/FixJ family response regulator
MPHMDVLLVDDHPMVLETLGAVTRRAFGDVRVLTANTLSEGLQRARDAERLDLVLLDLGLPGCSGIEALLRFRREFPAIRVLVVSSNDERACVTAALEAGAAGFIPKGFPPPAVAAAIRLVAEGGTYIPHGPLEQPFEQGSPTVLGLTEREYDVLRQLARGLANKDIARELDIAESTVKQHVSGIFRALGVSSRVEALVTATRRGIRLD